MSAALPTISSDAILVRLSYSSKMGETVLLKIEKSAWERLKANEGKNYSLVLCEVGNDGMPTLTEPNSEKKGWQVGERAKWVIERCSEEIFWRYLESLGIGPVEDSETAKRVVLASYLMDSRRGFDDSPAAFSSLR